MHCIVETESVFASRFYTKETKQFSGVSSRIQNVTKSATGKVMDEIQTEFENFLFFSVQADGTTHCAMCTQLSNIICYWM